MDRTQPPKHEKAKTGPGHRQEQRRARSPQQASGRPQQEIREPQSRVSSDARTPPNAGLANGAVASAPGDNERTRRISQAIDGAH